MTWRRVARLAQHLPGEAAHRLAVKSLQFGIAPRHSSEQYQAQLGCRVAGLDFPNPLGLAAGFDKDAEAMSGAFGGGALGLGFGFVEVGTITPKPQAGNAKPRVFRLPEDEAVINRYGFNNRGMVAAARNLARFRRRSKHAKHRKIIGVNIGANKDSLDRVADYYEAARCLARYADYMAVNISSPNTPGLRDLQTPQSLKAVLEASHRGMIDSQAVRPLFLKLSPDMDEADLRAVLDTAVGAGVGGVIIANTTLQRPDGLKSRHRHEAGGLSGRPLYDVSNRMLFAASQHLKSANLAERVPLIAVGGVASAEDAVVKLRLGASLVQLYTAFALHGPQLPSVILEGLSVHLENLGLKHLSEIEPAQNFADAFADAVSV